MKNIKAPDELKARTRAAVREEKSRARQPVRSMSGGMKRLLAAACAFAVVLGGAALHGRQTGSDPVTDIAHTFGLVAYAADTGEMRQPKDSRIVFDYGSGADDLDKGFFSGCLFKVTGENIKTVSASIDNGAIYRTKTVKDTSDDRDEWVRSMHQGTNPELDGADTVMVWGNGFEGAEQMYADLCWKLDNGFTDEYDPDASYGLWLPSRQESEDDDLQDSWHKSVDGFEGAKLNVTVTFTDGSEQMQSMTLHTGKLGIEFTDDTSGPQLNGEVLTDAQAEEQGRTPLIIGEQHHPEVIGAASWAYLGKSPARLSYGEAALLAVLPQAPSRLRPDRWPQRAQAARDKVLTRMVSQGVWPEQAVKEAMEEPVWLFPRQMPQLAPLFSRRALATSRDEKVVTTLDAGLQRQLEDLALNWKSRLPPRSSLEIWSRCSSENATLVVLPRESL